MRLKSRTTSTDAYYPGMSDLQKIYLNLTGSTEGFTRFKELAKNIADRSLNNAFIFKDEEKVFELFKKEFPELIKAQRIKYSYQLMELVDKY